MSQVLVNLVSNAIKYSPDGGRVEVELGAADHEATIRVSDDGVGIASDHQSEVFEPFRRGPGVGDTAGAGLGLSVCKRIVEAHGGMIGVDSEPGRGATFRVRVPRRIAAVA
jgi:signal transduction histidine kinase